MARPEGSRWSLATHERAPSLDRYGPAGGGVSEQQLLEPGDPADPPCRCGHDAWVHIPDSRAWWACQAMRDRRECECRAYDPELPGELAEAYGR